MGQLIITTGAICVTIYIVYASLMVLIGLFKKVGKPKVKLPNVQRVTHTLVETTTRVVRSGVSTVKRIGTNNHSNHISSPRYTDYKGKYSDNYCDRQVHERTTEKSKIHRFVKNDGNPEDGEDFIKSDVF